MSGEEQVEDELFQVEGRSQSYRPVKCVGREEEVLSTSHLLSAESRLDCLPSNRAVRSEQNNREFQAGVDCET